MVGSGVGKFGLIKKLKAITGTFRFRCILLRLSVM